MGITELFSDPLTYLKSILLMLPAILPALVLHEYAHAWVANRLGDPTPRMLGRLTLNPINHIDPIGLGCLVLIGLGWAKPVPINPRYYKHPRRDDLLVSLAGITMNLILFVLGCVMIVVMVVAAYKSDRGLYFSIYSKSGWFYYLYQIVNNFAWLNLSLAVFNLLPIPPLDGYHVLNDLVLKKSLFASGQAVRIGQGIMLLLLVTGVLNQPLYAAKSWLFNGLVNGMIDLCQTLGII